MGGLYAIRTIDYARPRLMLAHETGLFGRTRRTIPLGHGVLGKAKPTLWLAARGMKKVFAYMPEKCDRRGALQIRRLHKSFGRWAQQDKPDLSRSAGEAFFSEGEAGASHAEDDAKKAFTQLCSE